MPQAILQTNKLTKHYGRVKAVQQLDLTVYEGQVFGLLGPNGSGKTTTLGMLLGVVNPTSGDYSWYGKPGSYKVRQQVGAILEHPIFFPHLTARQNLKIVAEIKEVKRTRIAETLEWVGLLDRKDDKYQGFSLGMKQRLAIASALLSDPKVLILDEPTNGLDPLGIADIRGLIMRIAKEGKTIILASHLLDEVEKVCTDFCVLKRGVLIHSGNVAEELSKGQYFELRHSNPQYLADELNKHALTIKTEVLADMVQVQSNATGQEINQYLIDRGIVVAELARKKRTLENQFINLVANHE
jgi:ABC-type multidrug transport system ATPase subunit